MFHRSNITHCYHVTENELDGKQSSIQLTGRPEEWMDYTEWCSLGPRRIRMLLRPLGHRLGLGHVQPVYL